MNLKFNRLTLTPILAALALTLSACSDRTPNAGAHNQSITAQSTSASHGALTITDSSGKPIAGAKVLFGTALNAPFAPNLLTSNSTGQVTGPAQWTASLPITIQAAGFVRTTFMAQTPNGQTFQLRAQPGTAQLLVTGQTTGFGDLENDGTLDVGVVFPSFARGDLTNFELSNVISPLTDQISVFGHQISLPSNVTLPNQTETYIFFPLTFNKPQYRLYVNQPGTYSMVAEHAQFPFQKVAKALMGGGSLMDSINDVHFVSASVDAVPVGTLGVSMDLPVNQIGFDSSIQVTAPDLDPSQVMLSIALASQNAMLYPSDIKRLTSGQSQTLTYPNAAASSGTVLSALIPADSTAHQGADAERMSLTFSATNQSQAIDFLPMIAAPQVNGSVITASAPVAVANAQPILTYVCQSAINGTQLTPQWDVFVPGWSTSISLPSWPSSTAAATVSGTTNRWEITYAGGASGVSKNSAVLGRGMLEMATHLTRSAVDL